MLASAEHNGQWTNYTEIGGLVKFGILGPTELINRGEIVPLGPAKQRGMLAILLYHAGELVRTDTVIDHLWGTRG
jgi:DNA-binding SARP family transcriptional activator